MKSNKTILLILIIMASMIPEARAITPQSQTVKITDTHDDAFITEVGIGIDSSLVTILDPNMDIRAYLVFRELEINFWEPLKNATLRLHTSNTLDFDADSSITIYGMKLSDLQLEGFLIPSTVLSIGYTSALTNYNTSEFDGNQWHEINVTSIVEELIRNPNWDGDGSAGTETGDAIGFHIVGAEGSDKRYFYDYSVGNGLEAQLVIHWNHEPPPPSGYPDAIFNETYRGYHIWNWTDLSQHFLNFYFKDTSDTQYQNSTDIDYWTQVYDGVVSSYPYPHSQWKIGTVDDWIIIADSMGLSGQVNITWSDDYFEENNYYSLPNDNWDELSNWAGRRSSIWIDENGLIHIVYSTPTVWYAGNYNIIYFTFNILDDGAIQYSESFENVTMGITDYTSPDMYVQENGTVHVSYHKDKVCYRKRWPNGTWTSEVEVSPHVIDEFRGSLIVASETKGDALIVWAYNNELWWAYVFSNMTLGPARNTGFDCYRPAMVSHRADEVTHIAYGDSNVQPGEIKYSYKFIDNSSSWSGGQTLSPSGELYHYSTLGIDEENDTVHVMFLDGWHSHMEHNSFQIGDTPITVPTIISSGNYAPRLEPYPESLIIATVWTVTDENGTSVFNGTSYDETVLKIEEILGADPEDPAPPGWEETGPFTRFKTRFYILAMGFGLFFGPLFYFAVRRPSGYEFVIGLFMMLVGISFMIAAGAV